MAHSVPLTKFRIPRARADTVARPGLVQRLLRSAENNPLTLVCAPGGSGKTVLLTQLAAALTTPRRALWIAIDAEDNDANRFFAALVKAVEPLGLTWEVDPSALIAAVSAGQSQIRAALAALVNALCTAEAQRLVLILDDVHRLDNREVYSLLDALLERLPEHVALVLGTRVVPPLALARMRAHGELGELSAGDLQFASEDALALARVKNVGLTDIAGVEQALKRCDGWAVGLSMLLQTPNNAPAIEPKFGADGNQQHLFAYLAQEVLATLPDEMREFAIRASILVELDPAICRAVTGRADAGDLLRDISRRNLFVTTIDERAPVLRFHDLFRDFLQSELTRRFPNEVPALHIRAAQAERVPTRSVGHYLQAQQWQAALDSITAQGEQLIAEGAVGTIERWFEQIPADVRAASPQVAFLNGTCAWLRWDWLRAKRELPPAIVGLTAPQELPRRVRSLFQLIDALNSSGDMAGARAYLEEVARLPLDDLGQAQLALQRAWCLAPDGAIDDVAGNMRKFIAYAGRDPQRICPATAGLIHTLLIGKPEVAACFERFVQLAMPVRGPIGSPWHLPLDALDGWARIWRGDRAGAEAALARAAALFHQFRGLRIMGERFRQFRILLGGLIGELSEVDALTRELLAGLQNPELQAHRAVWERAYRHAHARLFWVHGALEPWRRLTEPLVADRSPVEWPFIDLAAVVVRGQRALDRKDWGQAISILEPALKDYPRLCMPMVYCDPRISLATAWLRADNRVNAWAAFEPVYLEAVRLHEVGGMLLDSRANVADLLGAAPIATQASPEFAHLSDLLSQWQITRASTDHPHMTPSAGPLSEREREVLALVASGASNKHIARQLSLSPHTVKRHLCNILDKLDCDSRGQAADWFRRTG